MQTMGMKSRHGLKIGFAKVTLAEVLTKLAASLFYCICLHPTRLSIIRLIITPSLTIPRPKNSAEKMQDITGKFLAVLKKLASWLAL